MATPRTVPWPCFKIYIDRFPTGQPNPIDRLINPRPDHVRSMVFTRPGSHPPRSVTHTHWERKNVKKYFRLVFDRVSTCSRSVTTSHWEKESVENALDRILTDDRPTLDRSTCFLDRSHTTTRRERKWQPPMRPGINRLKWSDRPVVTPAAQSFDRSNYFWRCFWYEKIDVLYVIIDKTYNS